MIAQLIVVDHYGTLMLAMRTGATRRGEPVEEWVPFIGAVVPIQMHMPVQAIRPIAEAHGVAIDDSVLHEVR